MRRQNINLLPTLAEEENIALPPIIDGQDLRKHRQRIQARVELVGLADRRHRNPDQLLGVSNSVWLLHALL